MEIVTTKDFVAAVKAMKKYLESDPKIELTDAQEELVDDLGDMLDDLTMMEDC